MRQDPREAFTIEEAQEFENWCDSIDPPIREDEAPLDAQPEEWYEEWDAMEDPLWTSNH